VRLGVANADGKLAGAKTKKRRDEGDHRALWLRVVDQVRVRTLAPLTVSDGCGGCAGCT
jgi:hypothetical protein